jgi:hypothetical protein
MREVFSFALRTKVAGDAKALAGYAFAAAWKAFLASLLQV